MKRKSDAHSFKELLIQMRARLRGDLTAMADSTLKRTRSESSGDLSSMPIHMADIGSDNFDQEFTLSLMENDEGTLEQIEDALERIESGTYGACVECGGRIPKARLNAIPYTTHCIKCASELQQR
jgi:DnaK suppressor protein